MSRIGYSAGARVWGPDLWQASVTATKMLPGKQGDALASRQARAMRAALLAAKAWANAVEKRAKALRVNAQHQHFAEVIVADAERRLYAAQERLAKIEKEVSRG